MGRPQAADIGEMTGKRTETEAVSRVPVAPSRAQRLPPDWRSLLNPPVRESAGFIVDRATLSWLPREFALEEGDAILRIDGDVITSTDQLIEAVRGSSEGSAVEFQIRLAGSTEAVSYSVTR